MLAAPQWAEYKI